jgi:hypothetical protein
MKDAGDKEPLDGLIALARQRRLLAEYRMRAAALRGTVDPGVYARVMQDYDHRDSALRAEAEPLKVRARSDYEQLCARMQAVKDRDSQARLAIEELRFRREVGELDEAQLAGRMKEPQAELEACGTEMAELERARARFVEAFDEGELDADTAPVSTVRPTPTMHVPFDASVMGTHASALAATVAGSRYSAAPVGVPPVDVTEPEEQTIVVMPGSSEGASAEETVLPPEGVLVHTKADGTEVEYRLGAVTTIGRAADNQIRIEQRGVSRRHAVVLAERHGFRIKDLQSQNGTIVNGEPVEECILTDGDELCLGEALLVFRMPSDGSFEPAEPESGQTTE